MLRKTEIHKALATYKFGDDTKSAEQFIIDFTNLFQQLEDLTEDISDWLPENQKMIMLKHAVYSCPDLRRVETDLLALGKDADFDSYKAMLQNAAILYDNQFKIKRIPKRGLNNHTFDYDVLTFEQPNHTSMEYQPDQGYLHDFTPYEEHQYQVNKQFQQQPHPYRVPGWLWKKISEADRSAINDYNNKLKSSPAGKPTELYKKQQSTRSAHLMEAGPPYEEEDIGQVEGEEIIQQETDKYHYKEDMGNIMELVRGELPSGDPRNLLAANKTKFQTKKKEYKKEKAVNFGIR